MGETGREMTLDEVIERFHAHHIARLEVERLRAVLEAARWCCLPDGNVSRTKRVALRNAIDAIDAAKDER